MRSKVHKGDRNAKLCVSDDAGITFQAYKNIKYSPLYQITLLYDQSLIRVTSLNPPIGLYPGQKIDEIVSATPDLSFYLLYEMFNVTKTPLCEFLLTGSICYS